MVAKRKKGRPPYEPSERDRKLVGLAAALGGTHEQIAKTIGVSKPTLYRHYRNELENGLYNANLAIATRLFKKAMDGDTTSCIFWLKCRGGWRETDRHELVGPNGAPFEPPNIRIVFGNEPEDKAGENS